MHLGKKLCGSKFIMHTPNPQSWAGTDDLEAANYSAHTQKTKSLHTQATCLPLLSIICHHHLSNFVSSQCVRALVKMELENPSYQEWLALGIGG